MWSFSVSTPSQCGWQLPTKQTLATTDDAYFTLARLASFSGVEYFYTSNDIDRRITRLIYPYCHSAEIKRLLTDLPEIYSCDFPVPEDEYRQYHIHPISFLDVIFICYSFIRVEAVTFKIRPIAATSVIAEFT
jgi:hypothetical protein